MGKNSLLLILGNQLFPIENIKKINCKNIFMKEDLGLCSNFYHHKLKILYFLTAMREYRDYLLINGFNIIYHGIENKKFETDYFKLLNKEIEKNKVKELNYFEIEDNSFMDKFSNFSTNTKITILKHQSPMFLNSKSEFIKFSENNSLRMSTFYSLTRKKLKLLVDEKNKPHGGKWSFDSENRHKLPKEIKVPKIKIFKKSKYHEELSIYINKEFKKHPGSSGNAWLPTCRKDALILF